MLEYRGYEVCQTGHSLYLYQNGSFVAHASLMQNVDGEKLYEVLDSMIDSFAELAELSKNGRRK